MIHGIWKCGFDGLTIAVNKVDTLWRIRQKGILRELVTLFSFRRHTVAFTVLSPWIYLKTSRMTTSKPAIFYGYYRFRAGLMDSQWTICVLHWIKEVLGILNLFSYQSLHSLRCSVTFFLSLWLSYLRVRVRGFWPWTRRDPLHISKNILTQMKRNKTFFLFTYISVEFDRPSSGWMTVTRVSHHKLQTLKTQLKSARNATLCRFIRLGQTVRRNYT